MKKPFPLRLAVVATLALYASQPIMSQTPAAGNPEPTPAKPELPDIPAEVLSLLTDANSLIEKGDPAAALKNLKKYRAWELRSLRNAFKDQDQNTLRYEQLQFQAMADLFEKEKLRAEAALQALDVETLEAISWGQFTLDREQSQWVQALRPRVEVAKQKAAEVKFAKWQETVTAFVAQAQATCAACNNEAELEEIFAKAIALSLGRYTTVSNQELAQRYAARLDAVKFTVQQLLEVLSQRALGREEEALDALGKLGENQREIRSILKLSQLKELEAKFGMLRAGDKLAKLTSLKDLDELEATLKSASKLELKQLNLYPERILPQIKTLRETAAKIKEGNSSAVLQSLKSSTYGTDSIGSLRSMAVELRQTALEMEIKKLTGQLPQPPVTSSQHLISALEDALAKDELTAAQSLLELLQSEFSKEVPSAGAEQLALNHWAAAMRYEQANDFQMAASYWRKIIGMSGLKYVPMAKFQKRLADLMAAHPDISAPGMDLLLGEMVQLRIEVRKLSDLMIRK